MKLQNIIKASLISSAIAISLSVPFASAIVITGTEDAELLANTLIIPNTGVTVRSFSLSGGFFDITDGGEGQFPGDGEFPGDGGLFNLNEVLEIDDGEGPPIMPGEVIGTGAQAGIFTNDSGVYGLPSQGGIVFSSGNVEDYQDGPNTSSGNTGIAGTTANDEQNAILSEITGQEFHFDPVQLDISFDVDESVDTISFIASFGSEEFPEFVGSSFIDGFALLLNGENVAGALPTGGEPGVDPLLPININHPDIQAVEGTELDGVLAPNNIPLVRFDIPVEPNSTGNTFTLLLADTSDSVLDTTIFLSSFGNFDSDSGESEFTPILPDPSNPTNEDGDFVFVLPEVEAFETIFIDPDVATGYTYTATTTDPNNPALFASVTAPSPLSVNDTDGYTLVYLDGNGIEQSRSLAPSETFVFPTPVEFFTITGIDPILALDPTLPDVFVTGVSFSNSASAGTFGVLQDPITTFVGDVPEPNSLALIGLSLFGTLAYRRRNLKK